MKYRYCTSKSRCFDNNALPAQPEEDKNHKVFEAKQSVFKFENSNNETPKSIDEIAQQKSNTTSKISAQQKPQKLKSSSRNELRKNRTFS